MATNENLKKKKKIKKDFFFYIFKPLENLKSIGNKYKHFGTRNELSTIFCSWIIVNIKLIN